MTKLLNSFSRIPKKTRVMILAVLVVLIAFSAVYLAVEAFKNSAEEAIEYDYNQIEQQVADETIAYLKEYLSGLSDNTYAQIADAAVQNYNIIITSDVDVVNDNHTDAIKQRIRSAMVALIGDEVLLTDDDLDGLSSGVAEIIWNIILSQIETTESDYKQEYLYLSESIQEQINQLQDQKLKVAIHANIKKDQIELSSEDLLAIVDGMNDEELRKLANSLGISLEDLMSLISSQIAFNNTQMKETIEKLTEETRKEILNEVQRKYGNVKDGKDGATGKDGKDAQDGRNGQDGKDGKTTYIAYADDKLGTGFSLTPTETTKYVGTCVTTESEQPTDYVEYSNWQEYRMYIITTTVDENNVTTVHIN